MNFPAFDSIVENQLYLTSRQRAWTQQGKPFNLPVQTANQAGAIFIKAVWKTLSDEEQKSDGFHTALAFMSTPDGVAGATCVGPVPVGLV